jgi:hypothetical protein
VLVLAVFEKSFQARAAEVFKAPGPDLFLKADILF